MPSCDLRLRKCIVSLRLTIITCTILVAVFVKADGQTRVRLCGRVLADMLDFQCGPRGVYRGKRSLSHKPDKVEIDNKLTETLTPLSGRTPEGENRLPSSKDLPGIDRTQALSFLTPRDHPNIDVSKRRGIVNECCVLGCTLATLERYCNKAGKRSDQQFWAIQPKQSDDLKEVSAVDEPQSGLKLISPKSKQLLDKSPSEAKEKVSSDYQKNLPYSVPRVFHLSETSFLSPAKQRQTSESQRPTLQQTTEPHGILLTKTRDGNQLAGLLKVLTRTTSTHFKTK